MRRTAKQPQESENNEDAQFHDINTSSRATAVTRSRVLYVEDHGCTVSNRDAGSYARDFPKSDPSCSRVRRTCLCETTLNLSLA